MFYKEKQYVLFHSHLFIRNVFMESYCEQFVVLAPSGAMMNTAD